MTTESADEAQQPGAPRPRKDKPEPRAFGGSAESSNPFTADQPTKQTTP